MRAVIGRNRDAFNLLLDLGADLEARNSDGHTVWYYAVSDDPDLAVQLLERRKFSSIGQLPSLLHLAIKGQRVDLLELLLRHARISDVNHVFEDKDASGERGWDSLL